MVAWQMAVAVMMEAVDALPEQVKHPEMLEYPVLVWNGVQVMSNGICVEGLQLLVWCDDLAPIASRHLTYRWLPKRRHANSLLSRAPNRWVANMNEILSHR